MYKANKNNNDEKQIPDELYFPKSIKSKDWENYLGRKLSKEEASILGNFCMEIHMNEMIDELYKQCEIKKICYIPMLTNLDGNCLFESLIYYKLCDNVMDFRKSLSFIMYIYKDYKNFLPGIDMTLGELFDQINEIEYVQCRNDKNNNKKFYKYTYNVMCQDLSNNHSWSKLPTQLLLLVISYIFKVEIIILNNKNSYETKINAFESIENNKFILKKIYLGNLNESHYIPLDILNDNEIPEPLYYYYSKDDFLNWAHDIENMKIDTYLKSLKIKDEDPVNKNINEFKDFDFNKFDSIDELTFNNYNKDPYSYPS